MKVPFLDLESAYFELKAEIDAAVFSVLRSACYILGPEVDTFEQAFSSYTGASYSIGVGSGLDALFLGLKALDIGPGDEVIVPTNTFIATWLAVSHCGATPIPVEPLISTANIDVSRIESVVTARTRAIIAVHLYGQPADLDPILEIAERYGLKVIEDAAQAHGSYYKGKRIGAHGDLVCWSFYPGKNLGAMGDGGAITTNNFSICVKLRELRNYGSISKYIHERKGYNSRLDPLQAAILNVKLKYLDIWNLRRKAIANYYLTHIDNPYVRLPDVPTWAESSWHLFVIRHPNRQLLQKALFENDIQTLVHYPTPPYRQSAYNNAFINVRYPIAEHLSNTILSLPIGPHLSLAQAQKIAEVVNVTK